MIKFSDLYQQNRFKVILIIALISDDHVKLGTIISFLLSFCLNNTLESLLINLRKSLNLQKHYILHLTILTIFSKLKTFLDCVKTVFFKKRIKTSISFLVILFSISLCLLTELRYFCLKIKKIKIITMFI